MNLFFRRLWLLISTLSAPKTAPVLDTYVRTYRVWLTDQDMFLHMTNSRYLSFSDLGRLNLLIQTGLAKALKQNGWRLEICGQTRTITRMLKTPQAFEMACDLEGWTDHYLAFRHQFRRREKLHAEVNTLMRVVTADGTPIATSNLLSAIGFEASSQILPAVFVDLAAQFETRP
ncbi:MAG: thioesterase family protein [Pseudomonadota bacterium]